jgi:hypothetical protein
VKSQGERVSQIRESWRYERLLTKQFEVLRLPEVGGGNGKTAMKRHLIVIAATTALTSGTGAADPQAMQKAPSPPVMHSMARSSLSLTPAQRLTVWKDIKRHGIIQNAPSNFTAAVGATLPASIIPHMLPAEAPAHVPSLKPYDYALLRNKLLIVNPENRKIVQVIDRPPDPI